MRKSKKEYEAHYRATHKEHIASYNREYRKRNREKLIAVSRQYYATHRETAKAASKRHREAHKEERRLKRQQPEPRRMEREGHIRRKYGVSKETFHALLVSQRGCCAICHISFEGRRYPCVDHCHTANRIRGLLCHKCNSALGLFGESKTILESAILYLGDLV